MTSWTQQPLANNVIRQFFYEVLLDLNFEFNFIENDC